MSVFQEVLHVRQNVTDSCVAEVKVLAPVHPGFESSLSEPAEEPEEVMQSVILCCMIDAKRHVATISLVVGTERNIICLYQSDLQIIDPVAQFPLQYNYGTYP